MIEHHGHRLAAIADGMGSLRLFSRNGLDRTRRFANAFAGLAEIAAT
jgi:ATP-dependent DNA ligase